jgi:GT2 family glycosyltransferase
VELTLVQATSEVQKGECEIWPKAAIVVLNWNGWRDTIECLKSLAVLEYPNYFVIVVDNGSTDDSVRQISRAFPGIEILQTGKNLGYSGGNNTGIRYALDKGADYIWVLNNDTRVEPKTLSAMVTVSLESGADIVGAVVKDYDTGEIICTGSRYPVFFFCAESLRPPTGRKWWSRDWVNGCAMLLRRDFLLEREKMCGYFFDESLFLYGEEIELAMWCRQARKKLVVAGEAVVYHKVSAGSGGRGKPLQFYYITRNRIVLARRCLRGLTALLFWLVYPAWRTLRAGFYLVRGRSDITKAIFQGLVDGLKGKTGPKKS